MEERMTDVAACIEKLLTASRLQAETLGNLGESIRIQTRLLSAQNEQIIALQERVTQLEAGIPT